MIPESTNPHRDYPQMAADRGRIEPVPRRVRGYYNGILVFDTKAAHYVWEVAYYPQYYVPIEDVDTLCLVDEQHTQKLQLGSSRLFSLADGNRTVKSAARLYDTGPLAGSFRFDWDALDWFEEDQPLIGHPRSPYVRVDALRSHRHVRIELDNVLLAETECPVLLFETGLPTRYYIDRTDIDFSHLKPSPTQTICPYKGITSGYWSVEIGERLHPDLAWTYRHPTISVVEIAGMVAFYNEKLDIYVDQALLSRPSTHFG